MLTLVVAIFLASLLGSLHCAGMCGAFLAIACGTGPNGRAAATTQAAYHAGRLITYLTLGILAGTLGRALDLASSLAGLQPLATALAGATLLLFGLSSLARLRGIVLFGKPPAALLALTTRGHRLAMAYPPTARAGMIGLLTTLLPCGWLYAFVATAAGTAHPLHAALVMSVFWLGTLPLLVSMGAGLRSVLGPLAQRLPALTAATLIALGLWTLLGRSHLSPTSLLSTVTAQAAHHTHPATTTTLTDVTPPPVPNPTSTPPCCTKPKESP